MAVDTALPAPAIMAAPLPVAIVAVYPVAATTEKDTASKNNVHHGKAAEYADAGLVLQIYAALRPDKAADPRLDLVNANLKGLPPTTIVLAGDRPAA